jgi:hypothetical protein
LRRCSCRQFGLFGFDASFPCSFCDHLFEFGLRVSTPMMATTVVASRRSRRPCDLSRQLFDDGQGPKPPLIVDACVSIASIDIARATALEFCCRQRAPPQTRPALAIHIVDQPRPDFIKHDAHWLRTLRNPQFARYQEAVELRIHNICTKQTSDDLAQYPNN